MERGNSDATINDIGFWNSIRYRYDIAKVSRYRYDIDIL